MQRERDLLWLFDGGLVLKAINGGLEMLGALLILVVPPSFIVHIVEFATAGELAQDPDDPIALTLRETAHAFAVHGHYLVSLYLIVHGAVKVFLVLYIFARKPYAYHLFIGALGLFSAYEAYRSIVTGGILLAVLAAFDFLLMLLAAHEYRVRGRSSLAL